MKRILHFSARAIRAVLITFALVFLALAIFLNSNYFDEFLKKQIETRLPGAIKRTVKVDSVRFNPFLLSVDLKNFTIGNDPRGKPTPFFRADEIYVRVSWRYLFGGKVRISEVRLIHPEIFIEFYQGGGNNWPSTGEKKEEKKKGLDLIIKQVNCDRMTVIFNQYRLPLTFSVKDLETFVEYDRKQNNYLASTSFKDGRLKITHFEVWQFDLKSTYRIIGGRVSFERLFLLTPQSKFYFAGDMYNLNNPFFDFRFRSHINLMQAKKIFHLGPVMSGAGSFHAVYKGTFSTFRMQGTGDFRNFVFYSLPINSATFDLDMTDNWLNVTNINAHMFDGGYTGKFSIAPLKGGNQVYKTDAEFKNWDGRRLGELVKMKDLVIPIKGSGKASLTWKQDRIKDLVGDFAFKMAPYEAVQFDLAAAAENSNFERGLYKRAYVLPVENETEFRIEGRQLRNLHSHLRTHYTDLDLKGTIDFSGQANLDVVSHTEKIPEIDLLFHYLRAYFRNEQSASQDFWGVKGSADFNGKLDSTVWSPFEPRLTGQIQGKNAHFHGVGLTAVRADVLFYSKLIQIFNSDLKTGNASATAKAKFFLADREHGTRDAMELTGAISNFPADRIAGAFYVDLPVYGTVNATIELHGPMHDLEGRSDFEALRGEMWGEKWDHASGTVLFFPDSLGLRDITAHAGDGWAQASGDLVYGSDDFNVEFGAENIPLEKLSILKRVGLEMYGVGTAHGSGHGTISKPDLQASLEIRDLVYKNEPYGTVKSTGKLKDGWLRIDASGVAHGVESTAHGELHLDGQLPFQTTFNIEKFPLEILTRAYAPGATGLTGLIGGKFEMNGRLQPTRVDHLAGILDRIQIAWSGLRFEQARPLNVQLSDQVILISDSLLVGSHASASLTGKIFPSDDWRLDLNLDADAGLELLQDLNKDITASGSATARIAITGTLQNPALTGVAEIKNGFFRHYSFPNSLTDISALFTFKNKSVSLQSLKATSSGGTMTAGGSATIKGYDLDTYRFDVYADHIRVHYPEGLRSTVNAELHLQSDRNASYLIGDINVLQGVYSRSFEETPDIFGYARVPTFAAIAGAPAAQQPMQLNVRLHSEGDLFVRNNFANIESFGDLNVVGTMENPVLVGRMEVRKGTIIFRSRQYNVVRGVLDFQNPYRTEPTLNFVAETRVREYNITLNFNGTFDRIYHDLSSDPPLPKDDIYALLGIGSTRQALVGSSYDVSTLIAGQQISEFIANPITSPLEKEFKKVFGLQRFQIDPTYVRTTNVATARVTVQKDISQDFSFTYSTNVFTTAEELILLQYRIKNDIQVTASKDERNRYGIDVLVTKTFE